LKFALSYGFEGVDYNLDYARLPVAPDAMRKLRAVVEAAGLPLKFHAPCSDVELGHKDRWVRDYSLSYLKRYADAVAELGGSEMTVHIGSRSIPDRELSFSGAVSALGELVAFAAERHVTVCLENLKGGWASDLKTYNAILEQTGAASTFDVGHAMGSWAVRSGELSAAEFVKGISANILTVHVYEIENSEGIHVPPEDLEGIGEALEAAVERGCRWLMVELPESSRMPHALSLLRRFRAQRQVGVVNES
jgi:sugar phosphate isomerase/epimerase